MELPRLDITQNMPCLAESSAWLRNISGTANDEYHAVVDNMVLFHECARIAGANSPPLRTHGGPGTVWAFPYGDFSFGRCSACLRFFCAGSRQATALVIQHGGRRLVAAVKTTCALRRK
jgi:hypothetical protein